MSEKRKRVLKSVSSNLSKDELLRRLKNISDELSTVDQDEDVKQFDVLASSLADSSLVQHSDKDVRLGVSCCLVDILRIYAPEPPYDEDQLRDILGLIIQQLHALDSPQSTAFSKAFYILESLALVKSMNICMEIDANDLIVDLFKALFDSSSTLHNQKIQTYMLDIMSSVLGETEHSSQQVLDCILANILPEARKNNPAVYKMANLLIQRSLSSLEPVIQMYFNNALILGRSSESELSDHLFELIYELNKICPASLIAVLPQLEMKIKSTDEQERIDVMKLLGKMFTDEDASDLAKENRHLWLAFLGRFRDISAEIRVECVKMSSYFLLHRPDLAEDITEHLNERFHDPEEAVRIKVVSVISQALSENASTISSSLIEGLQERLRDKKWSVRSEAISTVGSLFSKTVGSPAGPFPPHVAWIPEKLLLCYFQDFNEDRLLIERVFHEHIVPDSLKGQQRMQRLLTIYCSVDEQSRRAFQGMMKLRTMLCRELRSLLEASVSTDAEKEVLILQKIIILARSLPDPFKTQEQLKKIATMLSDRVLLDALLAASDLRSTCGAVAKAVADVHRKITARNPLSDTLKALLDRTAPTLLDGTLLTQLLQLIHKKIEDKELDEDPDSRKGITKQKKGLGDHETSSDLGLLLCLAEEVPEVFTAGETFEVLLMLIKKKNHYVDLVVKILAYCGGSAQGLDPRLTSCYYPVLFKLATSGSPIQAKYAVRCLVKMHGDGSQTTKRLFDSLQSELTSTRPGVLTTLVAMKELCLSAPALMQSSSNDNTYQFLVDKLISAKLAGEKKTMPDEEDDWCEDRNVTQRIRLKMAAIKLLVSQTLSLSYPDASLIAQSVVELLVKILDRQGVSNSEEALSGSEKTRLRLSASSGLLKLCSKLEVWDNIGWDVLQKISNAVHDPCHEVRQRFVQKIYKGLDRIKLPLCFLGVLGLVGGDPDKNWRQQVKQLIVKNLRTRREFWKQHSIAQAYPQAILPEYTLPCLVYILAHHKSFSPQDRSSIENCNECLTMVLEPLLQAGKGENVGFLRRLLETVKQSKDANHTDNENCTRNLRSVADLASAIIASKATSFVLKDFPGKVMLPANMFLVLKEKEASDLETAVETCPSEVSPAGSGQDSKTPVSFGQAQTGTLERTPSGRRRTPTVTRRRISDELGEASSTCSDDEKHIRPKPSSSPTPASTATCSSNTGSLKKPPMATRGNRRQMSLFETFWPTTLGTAQVDSPKSTIVIESVAKSMDETSVPTSVPKQDTPKRPNLKRSVRYHRPDGSVTSSLEDGSRNTDLFRARHDPNESGSFGNDAGDSVCPTKESEDTPEPPTKIQRRVARTRRK